MQQGPQPPMPPWTGGPGPLRAGMRWRVTASILIVFGWLIFILLYAAFWAENFNLFQNIVIFFASIIAVIMLLAVMWAAWGMRWAP